MKDFFTLDEVMIDLVIILSVWVLIYISRHITPLTLSTVVSGQTTSGIFTFFQQNVNATGATDFVLSLRNALGLLAVVLLAAVFWITIRTADIKKEEKEKYAPVQTEETEAKETLIQWQVILDHVNSESPAEWKLAILEADSILDEILDIEGYEGESLGEKLKSMSPSAIHSYEDLWDAHKMRNQIAHEGAGMELTKKMARDTINKFEAAFKELGHI